MVTIKDLGLSRPMNIDLGFFKPNGPLQAHKPELGCFQVHWPLQALKNHGSLICKHGACRPSCCQPRHSERATPLAPKMYDMYFHGMSRPRLHKGFQTKPKSMSLVVHVEWWPQMSLTTQPHASSQICKGQNFIQVSQDLLAC